MFEYKRESSLHFLSIHAIHPPLHSYYSAMEEGVTYHSIQGEFLYCGLLMDGQVLVSEADMDELLPLLGLQVLKPDGTTLYVRSGEECLGVRLYVQHIATENMEEEDEEDEEMIFLLTERPGVPKISSSAKEGPMQGLMEHLYAQLEMSGHGA